MQTICVVVCYFGQWPPWFDIFLKSCAYNPTVRFLFFTDCPVPESINDNLEFIPFSLEALNALAAQKLGLNVCITAPYKLCDVRPAYGVIFEEYLKEYDFWGYGDLDVVLGDVRKFLNEEVLTHHDVIATRKEYLSGHFTLYRNTERIRRLYEESADYKKVFESETYYCFDECHFMWHYLLQGGALFDKETAIDTMTHVVKRLAEQGAIRAYFENLVRERMDLRKTTSAWKVCWDRGRLMDAGQGEEFLYFHLNVLKKAEGFKIPAWRIVPDAFCVTDDGFSVTWLPGAWTG